MKRILFALAILIIVGMVGTCLGFGTNMNLWISSPYYRTAKKLEAEIPLLEVLSIKCDNELGILSMMIMTSGATPNAQPKIESAFMKLAHEDTVLFVAVTIYHFPNGHTREEVTSDYWVSGIFSIPPELVGKSDWVLDEPFRSGVWLSVPIEIIEGWRMW